MWLPKVASPFQAINFAIRPATRIQHTSIFRAYSQSDHDCELPKELQGISINEQGLLVDETTGKVINEFGATRFDVKVQALRGVFDPPKTVENTERSAGILLDSLVKWPALYTFNIVLRTEGATTHDELLTEMISIVEKSCQTDVDKNEVVVKERMNGKYLSLQIPAIVRAPELIQKVYIRLEGDARIVMKY